MKDKLMKNGVFSLEYDKETLRDMVLELQEENKDKINWYENFEINKTIDKLRIKHNNQQKEFIKYLENEKDRLARVCSNTCEDKFDEADDILQKYKEIIGDTR